MRRLRALGVGGAFIVGWGVACAFATSAGNVGCTTHQCDVPPLAPGPPGSNFTTLDSGLVLWESSPVQGLWVSYPHMQAYTFALPPNFVPSRPPAAWVSTAQDLGPTGGATYVQATGQLAQIAPFDTITPEGGAPFTIFNIQNGTCADYFLYVSVEGMFPPPPASDDAGTN